MRANSDTAPRFLLLWESAYADRVDELGPGFFIVGRDRSCHLVVDNDSISGRHASLEVGGGGLLELVDLSSATGTYVNGARVARCALREGDRVALGPEGELCFVIRAGRENRPAVAMSSDGPRRATAWDALPAPVGPATAAATSPAGAGAPMPRPLPSGSTTGSRRSLLKMLGALAALGVIVVGISAFVWYVLHRINDDRVIFDSPLAASAAGSLTNDGVEQAVRDFMSGFTKGGEIEVDGVRELPNENAATADLRFVNWVCTTTAEGGLSKQSPPPVTRDQFGMPSTVFGPRLRTYNVRGQAVLKHYTNGRWVLTEVRVGSGFNTVTVSGSVVVR
jgi:hypothetical protein